jgi:hypothetical protein
MHDYARERAHPSPVGPTRPITPALCRKKRPDSVALAARRNGLAAKPAPDNDQRDGQPHAEARAILAAA